MRVVSVKVQQVIFEEYDIDYLNILEKYLGKCSKAEWENKGLTESECVKLSKLWEYLHCNL